MGRGRFLRTWDLRELGIVDDDDGVIFLLDMVCFSIYSLLEFSTILFELLLTVTSFDGLDCCRNDSNYLEAVERDEGSRSGLQIKALSYLFVVVRLCLPLAALLVLGVSLACFTMCVSIHSSTPFWSTHDKEACVFPPRNRHGPFCGRKGCTRIVYGAHPSQRGCTGE